MVDKKYIYAYFIGFYIQKGGIAIRYKLKPLVLFSAGNARDNTTKVIRYAQSQQYQ
ncbi:hypothetical protein [Lactococcus lactis]|uniref:hypothetical protein n=1 Tax=Lactococcus lactis TaxID=1358 RepID=UPI0015CF1BFE|nr:hypothetical protein [Lactococcus lactis]